MKYIHQSSVGWWFEDETGDLHGPFRSERKAQKELVKYCYWLNNGPTRWQRIWWPVKAYIKGLFT